MTEYGALDLDAIMARAGVGIWNPSDVPALVAEVRRLRAERDRRAEAERAEARAIIDEHHRLPDVDVHDAEPGDWRNEAGRRMRALITVMRELDAWKEEAEDAARDARFAHDSLAGDDHA